MGVSFCLRLKKNHCIETENLIWQRLDELGIVPGTSAYFQGIRVRKTQPVVGFDIACKWQRNYRGCQVDEAWFILTDLGSLPRALDAYKQRMGIEEMFRDCKTGGYNLQGTEIQRMQVQKYVSRHKEPKRKYRRRSIFGSGLDGEKWINYLARYSELVKELTSLTRNKRRFYQQGMRAVTLIQSTM